MKKFLLPIGAGVVVFGAVTAFAATLNVTSSSLAAGSALVQSCNDNAAVSYALTTAGKVGVTTVDTSGAKSPGCGSMSFQVTVLNGTTVLATKSGTLSGGSGTVDFSAGGTTVDPASVTNVAVVITG